MAINIDTLVHNEFSRSATDQLGKIISKPADQVRSGVDRAVTEMLDNFSLMARDESGRQTIYEAARYSDDALIDDPAIFFRGKDERVAIGDSNKMLGNLVGGSTRDRIADAVRSASGLEADDADVITGYVAPGVLGVMKRQMLNGAVLDNSDGIGQMLLGETVTATVGGAAASIDHSVPKNAPRRTDTAASRSSGSVSRPVEQSSGSRAASVSHGAGASAAHAADGADLSWLFRWLLPILLLGGLMFAGLRGCGADYAGGGGGADTQKLSAVQTELDTALGETDGLKAQVASLTTERDDALGNREMAEAEVVRLNGELETTTASATATSDELTAANSEIDRLKEQLAVPADNSALEAANAEIVTLKEQLAQPADTSELDAANAEIVTLKEQLAQPADTSDLDSAVAEIARLQTQLSNVPAPVDNSAEIMSLKSTVDDSSLKVAQLESELNTVRTRRDELEESIAKFQAEKTSAEDRAAEMQENLAAANDAQSKAEAELESMGSKAADAEALVADKQAEIDALTADVDSKQAEIDALTADVDSKQAEIDALTADVDGKQGELDALASNVEGITKERDDAIGRNEVLQSDLGKALDDATAKRDEAVAAQDMLASVESKLVEAEGKLGRKVELSQAALAKMTKGRDWAFASFEDAEAKAERAEAALAKMTKGRDWSYAQLEETEAKLAKANKSKKAAIGTVTDLAGKLRSAGSERDALAAEKLALEESLAKSDEGKKAATGRAIDLVRKLRSTESERDALTAALAKSDKGKKAAIGTVTDLVGKLRNAGSERDALTVEKAGLEQSLADANAAAQASKDEVASVSNSLTDRLYSAGLQNVYVGPVEDDSAVGITMGSSDLYSVGSASLSSGGSDMLATVGSIVSDFSEWRIEVAGHTDAQPIGPVLREKYPSNWELSVARAAAAVRYLQAGVGIPASKLSVRGFGEHKPVDTNETAEGREANRRIELILRR